MKKLSIFFIVFFFIALFSCQEEAVETEKSLVAGQWNIVDQEYDLYANNIKVPRILYQDKFDINDYTPFVPGSTILFNLNGNISYNGNPTFGTWQLSQDKKSIVCGLPQDPNFPSNITFDVLNVTTQVLRLRTQYDIDDLPVDADTGPIDEIEWIINLER